jgi:hypothetical protein
MAYGSITQKMLTVTIVQLKCSPVLAGQQSSACRSYGSWMTKAMSHTTIGTSNSQPLHGCVGDVCFCFHHFHTAASHQKPLQQSQNMHCWPKQLEQAQWVSLRCC